jgi:hypothetical protein
MKQERSSIALPRPAAHVWRAAAAHVRSFVDQISPEQAAKSIWPDDVVTPLVLRAATTQATTTDPNWAGPLAKQSVSDAMLEAVAVSAIGKIIAAGALKVSLGDNASVVVPGGHVSPTDAGAWVGEGGMKPARQLLVSGAILRPHKIAVIVTMTRELTEASNIEDIVRALLTEASGLALDAAIFSATASSAVRGGGLFVGLTPIAASTGAGFDACGSDLGALAADIGSRGGGANLFFVAAPAQATAIHFYSPGGEVEARTAASAGLPNKTVAAIEPASLAVAISAPEFSVSNVATIMQDDSGTGVWPTGTPVKSMFQMDGIALRMDLWADWAMRAPHVAVMNSVAW